MSDVSTDAGDYDSAEADSLIQELLDGGFSYEPNDRLIGLARQGEETDDGRDEPDGASTDAGDDVGGDPVDSEDDSEQPGDTDDPDPVGPADPPSPGPLDGLSSEEQAGLFQLRQMLIEHPELSSKVNDLVADAYGGRKPVEEEAKGAEELTDALPDWIDPDEPAQVAMFRRVQELEARTDGMARSSEAAIAQAQQAKVQSDIATAVDRFKTAHPDLNDDDIRSIRLHTQETVNVMGVMSNFPTDPVEGLERALEIGSMTDPATRDKVSGINKTNPSEADRKRQADLNGLGGGSGGGTPRRPSAEKKPGTWAEVAKRLAKELEQAGPA